MAIFFFGDSFQQRQQQQQQRSLIKVQPFVRNRNIFHCLFHQYFKLFAFLPNQRTHMFDIPDFNNILYQSAFNSVSFGRLFVKRLYFLVQRLLACVCVFTLLLHFIGN